VPVVKPTSENIERAAELLKRGELVAFPTETVYGLGAVAFNERAVAKIFELKRRPSFDPLIVHIADISMLEEVCYLNEKAEKLIEKFWPGPLTLVLPKKHRVPGIVTSGLSTVAVRMPAHRVALELIKCCGLPVAAPSANPFGSLSPTKAEHVFSYFGEELFIIDGGECRVGVESTIVDLTQEEPVVLRPGGISLEELGKVLGRVQIKTTSSSPKAPGQLKKHYSPKTPLKILRGKPDVTSGKVGFVAFSRVPEGNFQVVRLLSPSGDLREAAANLFKVLHELDKMELDLILVEPVPEKGLGLAIMDRLKRAEAETEEPQK